MDDPEATAEYPDSCLRDEGAEARLFNQSQKRPVLYRSPAFDRHGCYRMTGKVITHLSRYTLVENYPAQG
jgi:hypothetical protein